MLLGKAIEEACGKLDGRSEKSGTRGSWPGQWRGVCVPPGGGSSVEVEEGTGFAQG